MFPASAAVPERTNQEYSNFVMGLNRTVPNMRLIVQDNFEPVIDENTRRVLSPPEVCGRLSLWTGGGRVLYGVEDERGWNEDY
jgi:hypothetical protein